MRLPTELWVKAYLRRLSSAGLYATVARHGDNDLGTIWIKVNRLDGTAVLLGPAPEPLDGVHDDRRWLVMHKAATIAEAEAETQLARARDFDSDLWIVEVEDRAGRHLLDDDLVRE
jgi:hypothetical protein